MSITQPDLDRAARLQRGLQLGDLNMIALALIDVPNSSYNQLDAFSAIQHGVDKVLVAQIEGLYDKIDRLGVRVDALDNPSLTSTTYPVGSFTVTSGNTGKYTISGSAVKYVGNENIEGEGNMSIIIEFVSNFDINSELGIDAQGAVLYYSSNNRNYGFTFPAGPITFCNHTVDMISGPLEMECNQLETMTTSAPFNYKHKLSMSGKRSAIAEFITLLVSSPLLVTQANIQSISGIEFDTMGLERDIDKESIDRGVETIIAAAGQIPIHDGKFDIVDHTLKIAGKALESKIPYIVDSAVSEFFQAVETYDVAGTIGSLFLEAIDFLLLLL